MKTNQGTSLLLVSMIVCSGLWFGCQNSANRTQNNQAAQQSSSQAAGQINTKNPVSIPPTTSHVSTAAPIVNITAQGFYPPTLTVKTGTQVTFVNVDTDPHWPASDPHPVHTLCPGFDAKKPLQRGDTFRYTFTKTCTYHDHLDPRTKGTITVK